MRGWSNMKWIISMAFCIRNVSATAQLRIRRCATGADDTDAGLVSSGAAGLGVPQKPRFLPARVGAETELLSEKRPQAVFPID